MIIKAAEYVRNMFDQKLDDNIVYHNINHTLDVVKTAEEIALNEKLSESELEILLIAAWFHDTGHLQCCYGHEAVSAKIAMEFLESENFPKIKINKIVNCINSTKIPQNPKSETEKILCDADLHHLGLEDIDERSKLLRTELKKRGIINYSNQEWLELSLKFFKSHNFFTDYARSKFENQKKLNLLKLEKEIGNLEVS
jgi:HD superfamily phosphodiesterase